MPAAKTRRVDGKIFYIENVVTNKRDAEEAKRKLLRRSFVGSVRRFKTAKGYEIGWSYR
jgi:hypothetical protein